MAYRHHLAIAFLFAAAAAHAGDAASSDLVIGMSTALSGPSQALGTEMKRGVELAFAEINAAGGVNGRMLRLNALDDGYEPAKAAPNMRELIDTDKVFAVLGNVGTPTAIVSVPIANEKKIPFFGAFTGSGILRKSPPDRYVWNYRASYAEETANMVRGLVGDLKIEPQDIMLFTQNDAYGDAGYNGAIKAFKDLGYKDIARLVHGRYQRNTDNVEDGLSRILDAKRTPKAVLIVGTYKAAAKFIKLAKQEGLRSLFINVSFVGSEGLKKELGTDAEGVIVTQVVPPFDMDLPSIKSYRKALGGTPPTFVSLEGYLAAEAFADGLRRAGPGATPETFIDALEATNDLDLGLGQKHLLSKTEHQISHQVWPTVIRGGEFRSFRWQDLVLTPSSTTAH